MGTGVRLGKGNFPLARAGVGRIPVFVPLPKSVLRGVRAGGAEEIILKAAMGNTAEDAENPEDADEAEIAFTRAVCAGQALAQALDLAPPDFDFSAWLTAQVQSGVVLGVMRHPAPAPK